MKSRFGLCKKALSVIFSMVFLMSIVSAGFVPKAASATLTLAELQAKFPNGKYWNHTVGGANNPDGYTSTPCNHHKASSPCSHSICSGDGGCCFYGDCGCNSFSNSIQCMGYTYKLGYDAYGSNPRNWSKVYNLDTLKAGDIIRYKNHSIFVTAVNGSTITFSDCNYGHTCKIRWNAQISKSEILPNLAYVLVAPKALSNSSSQSYIASDFNATIKDGTYSLKSAHTSGKMLNVNNGSVSCENGTKINTWSKDGSDDQKFYFKHVSDGKYRIYAVCSGSSGSVYKKVVDVNVGSNGTLETGDLFNVWEQNSKWDSCQLFYVVSVGGGKYVIELASKPNAVLACKSADTAATNGGAVTLRNYDASATQQWYFYDASGSAQVDPSIDSSTSASTKTYYTGIYKVNATSGLNIRTGAGTSYPKLDTIEDKTTLTVTRINGNWGETVYDGITGWICLDYTTYISPEVVSVAVKTLPDKTTYFAGDILDTSGLELTVNYSNKTTGTVNSGFVCSDTPLSSAGTKTVTVTYGGKTTTFNVTVNSIDLSSISVKSAPAKTSYFTGETLNTSGLALKLTYSNGTSGTVTSGFTCSPTKLSTAGTQKITVSYGGKTTSFNVTVKAVTLESVSVKTAPSKTQYTVGNTLDTAGLVLKLVYNDGSTGTASSGFTCSPTTLSTVGTQKITVNYNGKTTYFDVTVADNAVAEISVSTLPEKTDYYVGETLDVKGLTLNIAYKNGSYGTAAGGFTFTPSVLNAAGKQIITVEYGGKTTSFTVNVTEVTLISIAIKKMPAVTEYAVGESLNTNGLVAELRYNNGKVGYASDGFVCTPSVLSSVGTQTVTVSYAGKICTFDVTVKEFRTPSIEILKPSTVSINYGDTLTLHAKVKDLPLGAKVKWSVEGSGIEIMPSGDGTTCKVTSKSSCVTKVTAVITDKNGVPIVDSEGKTTFDEITLESKAGLLQRLISLIKNFFGLSRIIAQAVDYRN